jgi:hypothetical protein
MISLPQGTSLEELELIAGECPDPIKDWSLTSLKEKLIKIGAKLVSHRRYVTLQMAEVAASRQMFQEIVPLIGHLLWLGTIGFIFAIVTGPVHQRAGGKARLQCKSDGFPGSCWRRHDHPMVLDLPDSERFALDNLVTEAIETSRYPMSPRIR